MQKKEKDSLIFTGEAGELRGDLACLRWERQMRRHQRKRAWDAEGLSRIGGGCGNREQARWSCEGRMDKPGDTFDLVPLLRALFSLKCFKMTCPLSHCHMLIVDKYKKEKDVGGAHRIPPSNTIIDILAHFLLVLFSIHFFFSFCSWKHTICISLHPAFFA